MFIRSDSTNENRFFQTNQRKKERAPIIVRQVEIKKEKEIHNFQNVTVPQEEKRSFSKIFRPIIRHNSPEQRLKNVYQQNFVDLRKKIYRLTNFSIEFSFPPRFVYGKKIEIEKTKTKTLLDDDFTTVIN